MEYKRYVLSCADGRCMSGEIHEDPECPKCGLPGSVCGEKSREKSRATPRNFSEMCPVCKFGEKPFRDTAGGSGPDGDFWLGQVRSRSEILRMRTGKRAPVDVGWFEEKRADVRHEVRKAAGKPYGGFHDHFSLKGLERTQREYSKFYDSAKAGISGLLLPYREMLIKTVRELDGLLDGLKDGAAGTKSFGESKKFQEFKSYPAKLSEEGEKRVAKKRMYKDGKWQLIEEEGADLADRIKKFMKENPAVSYEEAAVQCEKSMVEERESRELSGESHFAEATDVFVERNEGVPMEALEKLRDARRGEVVTLSDGTAWVKVFQSGADRVLPVTNDGAEDAVALAADEKKFTRDLAMKKVLALAEGRPAAEQARGFSEDRKFFTTRGGTRLVVDHDEAFDAEALLTGFIRQHGILMARMGVSQRDMEKVAKKAMEVLITGDNDPMKSSAHLVGLAIKTALAKPEVFDAALRYLKTKAFMSFAKALVAAGVE